MDIMMMKRVISTLNTIEVKGRENMSSLLGCIDVLEGMVEAEEIAAAEAATQSQEETNG